MHCDEARDRLLDRLDTPTRDSPDLTTHLEDCHACRELAADILTMQSQARVWHEVDPPPWSADPRPWPGPGRGRSAVPRWLILVQQWFPALASSAALLLAAGIYLQDRPAGAATPAPTASLASTTPAAETLLAASRQERRQEMEALTALLKAEMDRRSLETEESLKYIIAHQIQSQRELESMRGRLVAADRATEQL